MLLKEASSGTTEPPEDDESVHGIGGVRTRENGVTEPVTDPEKERELTANSSESSSPTRSRAFDPDAGYNEASGVNIDEEKGRDLSIIDWYGPDDPEVQMLPEL